MALLIVERFVQQKNLTSREAQRLQLPAQLVIGMPIQPPRQQGLEMTRAQIHLHRLGRVQRIRQIANRALLLADDAAMFFGADNKRLRFALSQRFLAIGTDGLAGESIPRTAGRLAATARRMRGQRILNHAQPLHRLPSRSGFAQLALSSRRSPTSRKEYE